MRCRNKVTLLLILWANLFVLNWGLLYLDSALNKSIQFELKNRLVPAINVRFNFRTWKNTKRIKKACPTILASLNSCTSLYTILNVHSNRFSSPSYSFTVDWISRFDDQPNFPINNEHNVQIKPPVQAKYEITYFQAYFMLMSSWQRGHLKLIIPVDI